MGFPFSNRSSNASGDSRAMRSPSRPRERINTLFLRTSNNKNQQNSLLRRLKTKNQKLTTDLPDPEMKEVFLLSLTTER
jgi:hypothetical protein